MQYNKKRPIGRPKLCPVLRIWVQELRIEGKTLREIEEITGVSLATCYRYCKKL